MYPYEHMITMECKEVCIPGEVQAALFGKDKKKNLCSDLFVLLQIVYMTVWCDREGKKEK